MWGVGFQRLECESNLAFIVNGENSASAYSIHGLNRDYQEFFAITTISLGFEMDFIKILLGFDASKGLLGVPRKS